MSDDYSILWDDEPVPAPPPGRVTIALTAAEHATDVAMLCYKVAKCLTAHEHALTLLVRAAAKAKTPLPPTLGPRRFFFVIPVDGTLHTLKTKYQPDVTEDLLFKLSEAFSVSPVEQVVPDVRQWVSLACCITLT